MKATPLINRFNSGELSDDVDTRSDIDKYYSGCRTLQNMVPLPEGPIMKMPGSYYIRPTRIDAEGPKPDYPEEEPEPDKYLAVGNIGTAYVQVFSWDGSTLTLVAEEDTIGAAYSVAWNNDMRHLAVGCAGTSGVRIYRYDGSTLTLITVYAMAGGDSISKISWSPNSTLLAVAYYDAVVPHVAVFSWDGSTLSPLDTYDLPHLGGNESGGIDWVDSQYIAVGHETTPYLSVLYWDGASLALADTYTLPGMAYGVHTHPNTSHIVVANGGSPHLRVLSWSGSALASVDTAALSVDSWVATWHLDGTLIAAGVLASPYFYLFGWDGSNLTQLDTFDTGWLCAATAPNGLGTEIAVGSYTDPDLRLLDWDGSSLSLKTSVARTPTGPFQVYDLAWGYYA